MFVFAPLLAWAIGLSLGLLGSGGSIITLPVLVHVAGIPAHEAIGISLVVGGGTSLVGSLLNAHRGAFDWKPGGFFAVSGLVGAFVGAKFTHLVSAPLLLLLFGALMLIVGTRMPRKNETGVQLRQCNLWRCLSVGVAVGLLTGFLGVRGGFLILPALVLIAGLEMKKAIGTSLAIIAVNCVGGGVGQLSHVNLHWPLTMAFLAAAVTGMFAGTALTGRLSSSTLRCGFTRCVLLLGVGLVGWNGLTLVGAR